MIQTVCSSAPLPIRRRYFAPNIKTFSLPAGVVGQPYKAVFVADGDGPFSWSGDGLPDGLRVDPNGTILGTPTTPGTYRMEIHTRSFCGATTRPIDLTIRGVSEIPPQITTTVLPPAYTGRRYAFAMEAYPSAFWRASDLPRGLYIGPKTGAITGVTEYAGLHTVRITASNRWGEHTITTQFEVF